MTLGRLIDGLRFQYENGGNLEYVLQVCELPKDEQEAKTEPEQEQPNTEASAARPMMLLNDYANKRMAADMAEQNLSDRFAATSHDRAGTEGGGGPWPGLRGP